MTTIFGWAGKILRVNLSNEKVVQKPLDKDLTLNFLGGRGINVKLLHDELKFGIDPLGPENILIFGTGPLTGTTGPSAGRYNVTALSPLTGILGDSNSGGFFAPELKYTGFDHLLINGKAKKPMYLWINDDEVEFKDAVDIWGKDTWETQKIIREELGDQEIQMACIGPAGEKLVRFANVRTGLKNSAGRTGMGAVMGSKNLKAIAVRGSKGVKIARPREFEELCLKVRETLEAHSLCKAWAVEGTLWLEKVLGMSGLAPIRNWQTNVFPELDAVSSMAFLKNHSIKSKACFGCSMHCSHFYRIKGGPFDGEIGEGPEYSVHAIGPNCGNSDLPSILHMYNLCNKYGIDVLTTGNAIALSMELYQRGIISEEDMDGIRLEWGNYGAMIEIINKIANRDGFGNILAEGLLNAARRIGKVAERYVVHTKCLDYSQTEGRVARGSALAYSVSTRGADHLRGLSRIEWGSPEDAEKALGTRAACDPKTYEGKAALTIWAETRNTVADCLEVCKFPTVWMGQLGAVKELAEIFSAATGVDMDENRMGKAAERVYNVERAFIVERGITRADDYPPRRFLEVPIYEGPFKGERIEIEKYSEMLDEYYKLRGWTADGVPTRAKLDELDIGYIAEELEDLGKYEKRNIV